MDNGKPRSFTQAVAKWIRGRQVNIYVLGRAKPLTNLTVCSISDAVWVCRWNGSTHLIPPHKIIFIRWPPGRDPYDHPDHPLHETVKTGLRRTGRAAPVGIPDGLKRGDAMPMADLLSGLQPQKGA